MARCKKLLWIMAAAVLLGAACVVLGHALPWQALAAREAALHELVARAPLLAALAYVAAYILMVALSVPAGALASAIGGLLFGTVAGTVLASIGATLGAVVLLLMARGLLHRLLLRLMGARGASLLARLGPVLRRDGFHTLLALRLLPVMPFWLTNLIAAMVGMQLRPFIAATLIGTIPATAVFAAMGAGMRGLLASGARPDVAVLFSPPVMLPLVGLALLALVPPAWRRLRGGIAPRGIVVSGET